MFELCLIIGIFSLLKFNDTIDFTVSLGDTIEELRTAC